MSELINAFNPILVWFYLFEYRFKQFCNLLFQSHFGLILSLLRAGTCRSTCISFNPILVWFYRNFSRFVGSGRYTGLSIPFWSDFISSFCKDVLRNSGAFNPILVWFYLSNATLSFVNALRFQSHFGLILSSRPRRCGCPWKCFQSHFGLILSQRRLLAKQLLNFLDFQSHFGLILSGWERKSFTLQDLPFNPILVWFYRLQARITSISQTAFQSHFGLILSILQHIRWI